MQPLLYFFVFVFGTIIGSFLNVVIARYGEESLLGRSHCPSCGKTLTPLELIPIVSFLFLKGKCQNCRVPISFQYPIVEFLSGALFLSLYTIYGFSFAFIFYSVIWSILLVITVYDFKHTIIPDLLVFLFIFLSLGDIAWGVFIGGFSGYLPYLIAGPIFFTPFFLLWFLSKGEWMGLGDGKLALGIGFFLGLAGGFDAIILSFWIGAVVSLLLIFLQKIHALSFGNKKITMKSEIPFGPFLVLGMALVFFFQVSVSGFFLNMQ